MNMQWQIGGIQVTRIEEIMGPMFDPPRFLPDFDPAVLDAHADWLVPDHFDRDTGLLVASMHSWLIETAHHKVLIDTCIGDDKPRMPYRNWHEMRTPWLGNLKTTGVSPGDIDFVMCTHLHVDHVGWNTRLQDGQWVPTFPNAKYIFSKQEFEFWQTERASADPNEFKAVNNQTFDDSVLPIMHLAELVEGEAELIADLLRIKPAPGHTPGSIAIELTDGQQQGLFTGDICHHPLQVIEPDWNSAYCELPDQARATRKAILGHCCNHGSLMLPAHFGGRHAGYVRDSGAGFSFEFS